MNDFPVSISIFHSAFGNGFTLVASFPIKEENRNVESCLERGYILTNTITENWWLNTDLDIPLWIKERGGARSTSMGDYFRVTFMKRKPEWYRVDIFGFHQVFDNDEVEYISYPIDENGKRQRKYQKMTFRELRRTEGVI